ncbi:hypothetical protein TNCV_3172221 [Trichonephila clavipes]|nr:hypothetical protein TNCV_3172221 [Trichonephila clavipes]
MWLLPHQHLHSDGPHCAHGDAHFLDSSRGRSCSNHSRGHITPHHHHETVSLHDAERLVYRCSQYMVVIVHRFCLLQFIGICTRHQSGQKRTTVAPTQGRSEFMFIG